jgi:hypothetical protein
VVEVVLADACAVGLGVVEASINSCDRAAIPLPASEAEVLLPSMTVDPNVTAARISNIDAIRKLDLLTGLDIVSHGVTLKMAYAFFSQWTVPSSMMLSTKTYFPAVMSTVTL